jgi:calcium-dependent protein kinase
MTKAEREELGKIFKSLDMNNNGCLSKDELKQAYHQHANRTLTDEEIEKIFDAVDTDMSGSIDYTEFMVACEKTSELLSN